MSAQWIQPDWPAPANVRALITTRAGGVSRGPYGVPPHDRDGMNIGLGSGDERRRRSGESCAVADRRCRPSRAG